MLVSTHVPPSPHVPLHQALNYRQAAFCYEELLLHTPNNSSYHVRYADVLYTIGGSTNYK